MRRLSQFTTVLFAGCISAGSAFAAPINLTSATPSYTYDAVPGPDPNITLGGNMQYRGDASYYTNDNNTGTLSYTFSVAASANNLKIDEYNLYAFGGSGSITATYTMDGGSPVTLYTDVTASIAPGAQQVVDVHHVDNIALDPAAAHVVVLTLAENASSTGGYQQQSLRHGNGGPGADGGPFIATATFVPEPASIGALGLAGVSLLVRRHRL